MKKIKHIRPNMSFAEAAAKLGISDSTVLRLVQRGTLYATKPQMWRHHWTRFILEDKAFKDELARRTHGLKAPRRKHIPAAIDPLDPSPIQTVTPPDDMLEKCRNAMNICLEAQKDCQDIKDSITRCNAAALQEKDSACRASQKEELCNLHATHASEWCDKAQKAYIACAEESRGSLRCAAWCTLACIIAAIILIANIFA